MSDVLLEIRDDLRVFATERDWDQFHSPKNLACALAVEAGELLEHFQWEREEYSRNLPAQLREAVSFEMADILIYLARLEDKLEIDLQASVRKKLDINARKYPVDVVRGSSKKYTDY